MKRAGEKFGFIGGRDADYFYLPWFVFDGESPLTNGQPVVFQTQPAKGEGKNDQAVSIFPLNIEVEGEVVNVTDRGFGFVNLTGSKGQSHRLFVLIRGIEVKVGDRVVCLLDGGDRGPVGTNLRLVDDKTPPGSGASDVPDL